MVIKAEIRDNKFCIEIDLEKLTASSSGKRPSVASNRDAEKEIINIIHLVRIKYNKEREY
jgi:hypothetical protein